MILYTGKVDDFCIDFSDSDFTGLPTQLKEAGMKIIGIGEMKTLNPFIIASKIHTANKSIFVRRV
jgi:hypothetical protein